MPKLFVEKGPDKGKELVVKAGENVIIGREPTVHFVVSDAMSSRKHCVVGQVNGHWLLKDLNSANGTFKTGRQIAAGKAVRLEEGESFQIGETLISFVGADVEGRGDPLIGTVLAGYRIDKLLGRGAMGVVYRAHQLSLGRDVAFKLLSGELSGDERFNKMFIKEARAAAALNHPNVLQVYDVGTENGRFFMSMEIAEGGSVLEELRAAGRIELDRSIEIIQDALSALEYASKKDIVHRDIKPDNLMMNAEGVVKLGDLGLAASSAELQAGQSGVFGTPHYIAPEQAMGKGVDRRADIYSLGATWYRLLSGQTLFTGNNVRDILRKQVRDPHTPLKQIVPDVPQAISNIIDKMLAKDPANRYQNASEASADIESFLANRHAAADALANKRQRHAIVAETKKPNYALIGIIGGVTVLAIAIIAAIALSDGGDANGPVVINNNTNGHTNQNTAPSPEEGEAEKKYIEAATKEKLGAANPTLLQQAMSDYKYIVATWPKTNAATKASARLKAIEETYGREILEEQQARAALKEEWDKLSKEINDVLLPAFKIGEALGKIDAFDEKIKAYKRETIRVKLRATLNIELARTHAETTGVEAIRSELNRIAQPTTAMDKLPREDQVTRYESAIAGAQALIEKIDDERYESDVIRQITEWTSKKELITGQIANIALAKRVEAAKTTRVALDALCARVNKNVRSFAFKAALREIDTFENTDPGLKEYRNSPEFKDAVTTLADLKRQVERERDGLRWLVENWRTGGTAAEVKGDKGLELVFPGAEYVSIFPVDKDVFDEDDPKFRAEESTGSVSKSRKLYAFKSRNIASLEVILGAIRRVNSSFNDELKKAENIENVIGIVALLLELGAEGRQAGDLAEFALAHAGSVDAAKRRQIREFMAYGLVARAKYFEANGDKQSALGDYKRLKEEFADTRAAKGAKG